MAELYTTEQLEGAARQMRELGTVLDSDLARAVAHAYLALRERWARVEAGMQRAPIVAAEPDPSVAAIDRLTHAVLLLVEAQGLSAAVHAGRAGGRGDLPKRELESARDHLVGIMRRVVTLRDRLGESSGGT